MLFSERNGYTQAKKALQLEEIDKDLRVALFNAFHDNLWRYVDFQLPLDDVCMEILQLTEDIFRYFFKFLISDIPGDFELRTAYFRKFFLSAKWFKVFDFIEFVLPNLNQDLKPQLIEKINEALEYENSGYRLIAEKLVTITSEDEIDSVANALEAPFDSVKEHLKTAIVHMSNRENPDYRNSIKESISAVEAIARILTCNANATLGQVLNQLERESTIPRALKNGFSALYGWTSGDDGIRHAMLEKPSLTVNDAKFMLVACSAFVNYIIGRCSESGILNQLSEKQDQAEE